MSFFSYQVLFLTALRASLIPKNPDIFYLQAVCELVRDPNNCDEAIAVERSQFPDTLKNRNIYFRPLLPDSVFAASAVSYATQKRADTECCNQIHSGTRSGVEPAHSQL